jgi:hypothetical protein
VDLMLVGGLFSGLPRLLLGVVLVIAGVLLIRLSRSAVIFERRFFWNHTGSETLPPLWTVRLWMMRAGFAAIVVFGLVVMASAFGPP